MNLKRIRMYFQRGNQICFWTPLWSSLLKYIWVRKFVKNFKKSIKSIKRIWDNDSLHTCFESTLCRVRKHIVYQEPANKYEFIHPDRLVLGQKTGKSSKIHFAPFIWKSMSELLGPIFRTDNSGLFTRPMIFLRWTVHHGPHPCENCISSHCQVIRVL